MKELLTLNKILFSMIGGLIGSLFGELDGILYALLVFIIIDYLTGIFAAVVEKQLSSSIGFRGIFKKIAILFLVSLGHLIDTAIIKQGGTIRTMVIFFYLSNEGLSILENTVRIGLPIPEKLQAILKQINER
ncbi:TPA: phage holin family protein [Streptococcus suis]|jgi:toxin secretion/phage lysis holin|uniref:Holin n=2 Tax=Streptococcus TaxID=1301 RepID=A0A116LW59_STRSU|nr:MULTISPECIES: phage holin family protein [Streptococcus]ALA07119.1 holin [Streptococcus phage phiSC070807]MBY5034652.1 phage holin family protein [Streptococcus gallolyticus]QGJ85273.1 holin [Streptococcus phage phi-SgaBSJ27_rum]QGJ85384.1 holin [Streptococcus phage phi-SgaBSJ31_rum]QGJ85850.1 holin [Streptococcus phage phi-SsuFJZZ32_rum]QGJ85929.1 holin [Streptococcus phage phi-SsuFJZZ39_rum]QGJ86137.1 holin [Streptococcus phage phi-SsuJS7_SSU0237]QGJ86322.1 holin [Streptococcus phage p